jgi:hypothetical protein
MFDAQLLWQNRFVLKDIWCHRVTSRFDDPPFPMETIKKHRILMENLTPDLATIPTQSSHAFFLVESGNGGLNHS